MWVNPNGSNSRLRIWFPTLSFDDHSDKQVVGIAISIAFSGRKIGFLLHSPCDERARLEVRWDFHIQLRELRGTVGLEEAAAHIAELAHGDALGIRYGHAQREAAKRVVEAEFFRLPTGEGR